LSSEKAVLVAQPLDFDPRSLLWSNDFATHLRWRPQQGTRLVVIDRGSGGIETFEAEALFAFHCVNTFHDGGDLVLDLLAYEDAGIVDAASVEQLSQGFPDLRATLTRVRMTPGAPRARLERLADVGFELPQINHPMKSARRHRYV